MKVYSKRPAFSMIELIFVIIVLGIVASIGSEIIFRTYAQYITQRAQHRASVKTQVALNLIANRLRYAIPGTLVRKDDLAGATTESFDQSMSLAGEKYKVLQWVGYDGDSFESFENDDNRRPGWSGFVDLPRSTADGTIATPGSNLALIDPIIKNLGGTGIRGAVLYFAEDDAISAYGVGGVAGNIITLDSPLNGQRISERYKLAWTSYALEVDKNNDLVLHYNFAPIARTPVANSTSQILLRNIENFKFFSDGGVTRIKLCVREQIGDNSFIPSCKEKVVF